MGVLCTAQLHLVQLQEAGWPFHVASAASPRDNHGRHPGTSGISEKNVSCSQMSRFQDWLMLKSGAEPYFIAEEITGPKVHCFFLHLLCPSCLIPAEPCLLLIFDNR